MPDYQLSHAAKNDLIHIAQYGDEQYGMAKSNQYRDQLKRQFLKHLYSTLLLTISILATVDASISRIRFIIK